MIGDLVRRIGNVRVVVQTKGSVGDIRGDCCCIDSLSVRLAKSPGD